MVKTKKNAKFHHKTQTHVRYIFIAFAHPAVESPTISLSAELDFLGLDPVPWTPTTPQQTPWQLQGTGVGLRMEQSGAFIRGRGRGGRLGMSGH